MTNIEKNKFKAILFDLDGTLLDSLVDLAECANKVLKTQRLPTHPIESYGTFVGDGVRMLLKNAAPIETPEEVIDECIPLMKDYYNKNWAVNSNLYEGIPQLLDTCIHKKISLNILSNKPDAFCHKIADHFLNSWSFDIIRGAFEEIPLKPDPTSTIDILSKSPIPVEQWLYLGDTDTDMKTATNANMTAVGVSWGFREKKELMENGANFVIDHPLELLDYL
jgi:phosphoglycolate phosphatase